MKNSTGYFSVEGTPINTMQFYNYPLTSNAYNAWCGNVTGSFLNGGASDIQIFKSAFTYSVSTGVTSNEYALFINTTSSYISLLYKIDIPFPVPSSTYSVKGTVIGTWFNTTAGNFSKYHGLAIYNDIIYYSTSTYTIGTAKITDATSSTTTPTCSLVSNNYLTALGGTSTYYPIKLTCDTTGKLYIVMGNTSTNPSKNEIVVYNNTNYLYTIDFSNIFSRTIYGYYYSIKFYNNTLYIGTYVGIWSTSTTGHIFTYNITNNILQLYTSSTVHYTAGLDIYSGPSSATTPSPSLISVGYIPSSSLHWRTMMYPINTLSGFYTMGIYTNNNTTTYNVDMASIS